MQRNPLVPPINPPKEDKPTERVATCNPKTYAVSYDPCGARRVDQRNEKDFYSYSLM